MIRKCENCGKTNVRLYTIIENQIRVKYVCFDCFREYCKGKRMALRHIDKKKIPKLIFDKGKIRRE